PMGQPITVSATPGSRPGVWHFELNRSVTGMEIKRYRQASEASGDRIVDRLARELFALGVESVTIYSSVVTVVAAPHLWRDIESQVEETLVNLFVYYPESRVEAGGNEES
ncbi:MAG: hypothetical protein ACRDV9_09755, partial [Acidimicrobiia bacterium]